MPCKPLLDELLPELELDVLLALELDVLLALLCPVVVACADPGRLAATPAAVTTLASPAAAVMARILARLRSLAAICGARLVGRGWTGSGGIGCLPLGPDDSRLACLFLKCLCARRQLAQGSGAAPVTRPQ